MKKFNEWLAIKITLAVSTMWTFYLFCIYGLIPAFFPQIREEILYWSNYFQLIFLPAITIGTALLGRKAEQQAQETHDTVMTELGELKEIINLLHGGKNDGQ